MQYIDQRFDAERALYAARGADLLRCTFDGPADGESALKESRDVTVTDCDFRLRYPLWHVNTARIMDSRMGEGCRAALWYCDDVEISRSSLGGIKALRECANVAIRQSDIQSAEFGWRCDSMRIEDSSLVSEYPFLFSRHLDIDGLRMQGKYSFQYVGDVTIRNSYLKTKDAFWHSRNVTVYDTVLDGEYLGWYSENLRLVRCRIIGTQPLCYANGLVLEDCTMERCDLSFENSDVTASVIGSIDSVRSPRSGRIVADAIGAVIDDTAACAGECELVYRDGSGRMKAATLDLEIGDRMLAATLAESSSTQALG